MSAELIQQKEGLEVQLTMLFGPILRLFASPGDYDTQERMETIARYSAEYDDLVRDFRAFCNAQPGLTYTTQLADFRNALIYVQGRLKVELDDAAAEYVRSQYHRARAAIAAIPIPRNTMIFDAHTPFSTYRTLKALCVTEATTTIVCIDSYLDKSVFDRYMGDVMPEAVVTLVTKAPHVGASRRDQRRWEAFLDVSALYAEERGAEHYRLIVHADGPHDRWILFGGDRLYSIGISLKDAGSRQYSTLHRLDASPANLAIVQNLIDTGVEYFGPSTPTHRT